MWERALPAMLSVILTDSIAGRARSYDFFQAT
jgi:hypothetical protein